MDDFINPPIVICSTSGRCLPVLMASIEAYVPEGAEIYWAAANPIPVTDSRHTWHVLPNTADNFGDAYNAAVYQALDDGHNSVIMANDDIVLTPYSYTELINDVNFVHRHKERETVGLVAARSDGAGFFVQNIRFGLPGDTWTNERWVNGQKFIMRRWAYEERTIGGVPVVAPIFAWIAADAFRLCPFPPLTAFSDVVQCYDFSALGKRHFVSRSYVHHVGNQTARNYEASWPNHDEWIKENRPHIWEYVQAPYELEVLASQDEQDRLCSLEPADSFA